MTQTALLIGLPETLRLLERQLDLLPDRPASIGWVVVRPCESTDDPVLGDLTDLESIVVTRRPTLALVCLPAVMADLVNTIRTQLRRLGVPDRFMPTLADQLAGIGPRSRIDLDPADLIDREARWIDHDAVRGVIAGRRVMITGAGGTIGSELARIVAGYEPEQLMLMDRSENALFEIDRQIARRAPDLPRRALLHDVVNDEETLNECRRLGPEVIFHAAAHKHVAMMEDHPGAAIDNNLFGTRSIADAADAVGADRFVMISTDKAVNPSSIMGATKRLAELYVQWINERSDTTFSLVRFGNVLGSSGSALEIWSKQIADGGPVTVTDPRMTRYFMTIPEAAALVIQSAALVDGGDSSGAVYMLDMGEPIRILSLAERFIRLHGLTPVTPDTPQRDDGAGSGVMPIVYTGAGSGVMPIVYTGARPGEKLHEELSTDAEAALPTRHPDIHRLMLPTPDDELIKEMRCSLTAESRGSDSAQIAERIRRLLVGAARPIAA
jgi:FlaA1/EpsC-like NDP-sugar epimerase